MTLARIDIDVGGTFTDVHLFDQSTGRLADAELPSAPTDPSEAIVNRARLILDQQGISTSDVV